MSIWKKWAWLLTGAVVAVIVAAVPFGSGKAEAAAPTMIQYGSNNGDVWDLQYRLQQLGLYRGKLDGIYGLKTEKAVIQYQIHHKLRIDGITGPQTWGSLKRHTVSKQTVSKKAHKQPLHSVNSRFSKKDISLIARAVYSEARGEPYKGQVAVAAVILNRIDSPEFPKTVSGVIFQDGAFTAVQDGQFWLSPNSTAYRATMDAIRGWDPTNGALYYFNPDTATSDWIWSRPQIKKIGKHIFTK
ncbi:spore cortex-lytic enzyme [Polycladomyces abyssicola]|jgi:N-acetylmuramoyl-L-alanine amidase|uniref:Spore cortex-lytic enzyme n=1 Tax=Polycladomyces abyssicola TaxID=1125966 RepID=A0A8D5ZPY4_9BACL|nr:spore cortex-lytic enzyme [Polycladomyces abyssicola]BCU82803.1 spore cortex-lytic enzyme [Polycladomyces abyssicola]